MKNAILFILLLVLSLFAGSSFATEVFRFGPHQYIRTTGAADIYNDTFSAVTGEARLIVRNGFKDKKLKISNATSSASVVVNGEEVFGPNDFNQKVHLLETSINLSENNAITIELTSGPGSYLTIEVMQKTEISLEPPTCTINVSSESIQLGESLMLSWNSTNADFVTLDQGIGAVSVNGSMTVSPAETTTYTITATGVGGTATATVQVTVASASDISLQIISPEHGTTIFRPDILVQGTVTNATGKETGITVNGVVANVYGDRFIANHVPLQEGENTITVKAMDIEGNTAAVSTSVNAAPAGNYISIILGSESGIAPLETNLMINGSFSFDDSSLICSEPGTVEIVEIEAPEEFQVQIAGEGIFFFTAQAADSYGITYMDTVAVVALNRTELDALLRDKWEGMKTSLINGDIEGSLFYFHETSKEHYRKVFNLLINRIADIASTMREIGLITADEKIAKYRIRKEKVIQGETHDITYYIYFIRDFNGLWHIKNM